MNKNTMNYYTDVIKKYVVFAGRASRKEYWMFTLLSLVVSIAVSIVEKITGLRGISSLYALFVFLPSFALSFRRLHDTNRSAWWLLLLFVPIAGWITIVVFMALEGQPGDNRFGPSPKTTK